ncbi:hypothetical protein GCM10028785_09140 [Hydrogenophaga soli]
MGWVSGADASSLAEASGWVSALGWVGEKSDGADGITTGSRVTRGLKAADGSDRGMVSRNLGTSKGGVPAGGNGTSASIGAAPGDDSGSGSGSGVGTCAMMGSGTGAATGAGTGGVGTGSGAGTSRDSWRNTIDTCEGTAAVGVRAPAGSATPMALRASNTSLHLPQRTQP